MRPSGPHAALLALALIILPACSGSDSKGGSQGQTACDLHTQYAGDANCILPPTSAEGFQIHVGPTNYDDPNDVGQFLLDPGKETVECWNLVAPNDHDMYNQKRQYRMRPNSHHLILKEGDGTTGWGQCPNALQTAWGGSQGQSTDIGYGDIAPEDADFASHIPAHRPTSVELHFYNTGDKPILREAWVNFYEADPNRAWKQLGGIALIGANGLVVAPQTTKDLTWSVPNTVQGRRIVNVVGHVHSHTQRFTATRVTPSGARTPLYELDDWEEPHGLRFNTIAQNPPLGTAGATETGVSGLQYLDAGDSIEFTCHVVNTLDTTLVFANEALTAEMCILFGSTVIPDGDGGTAADEWQAVPQIMQ